MPWRTYRCALTCAIAACVPPDPPSGSAPARTGTILDAAPGAAGAPVSGDLEATAARLSGPTAAPPPIASRYGPPPIGSAGAAAASRGVVAPAPLLATVFRDSFARDALGGDYHATSPAWRVQDGQLCGRGARNHPVWLRRGLPANARIEFVAVSRSLDGDVKVEAWGDGVSHATSTSYRDATSYLAVFGGWKNRLHVLARLDEHGPDRVAVEVAPNETSPARAPVLPGRAYRFRLERTDGRTLRWFVDDVLVASFTDPAPLAGAGHDRFAFNGWEAEVCFDDLVITPL